MCLTGLPPVYLCRSGTREDGDETLTIRGPPGDINRRDVVSVAAAVNVARA